MSAFQKLLVILSPVLLFLIGAGHLVRRFVHRFAPEAWGTFLESQINVFLPPLSQWALMLLALVVPLCLVFLYIRRMLTRELLVLKTRSGHLLRVRQVAVNRHIHDRLKRLSHVRKVRIQTRTRKHGLHVAAQIWTASDRALDAVQDEVRTRIVNDCKQGLGVATVYDPELQFESLAEEQSLSSDEGEPKRLAAPESGGGGFHSGVEAPWTVPEGSKKPEGYAGESAARYTPPAEEPEGEPASIKPADATEESGEKKEPEASPEEDKPEGDAESAEKKTE